MRIAFTTSGNDLDAPLDSRFGRAPRFLILDPATDDVVIVDNIQNLNAAQGAGIQTAQTVVRAGATHLITGHCGPKAFRVLAAAGIKVHTTQAETIREALDQFKAGVLQETENANVEGHWS